MWTRIVSLSAACTVTLYGAALLASEPEVKATPPGTLWSQTPWLRLEIVGGRVTVTSTRCGTHRLAAEPSGSDVRESLAVQVEAGTLTAQYEQLRPAGELTLAVDARERLCIVRRHSTDGATVEVRYEQPATGEVTLLVGGQQPQRFAAASLWHLLLVEHEITSEHLLPVLAEMRPNWQIVDQLADAERALIERAGQEVLPERRQWRTWVDQLASDSFVERQAADRALRTGGQSVLGFLRQLEASELDPEQERRIAGIVAAAAKEPDSPSRVAEWLLADKRVWLGLISGGEVDQRIAAAEHLSRLCGRALSFDPQASADLRRVQLAELRAKLAEK
jgi:hypothetical protein